MTDEKQEPMSVGKYAKAIADNGALGEQTIEASTARAALLLIAASQEIHSMAHTARHSVVTDIGQAAVLDRAAKDAASASKDAQKLAQGAIGWARAISPELGQTCKDLVQGAVNEAGWNPRVRLSRK